MLHITRSSSQGVCYCKCKETLMAVPNQLDCPWCGCGWLFTCALCGKSFTFGRADEVEIDLDDYVRQDFMARGYKAKQVTKELVSGAKNFLLTMFDGLEEGVEYVYLDGVLLPWDLQELVEFDGIFAHHSLKKIPHDAGRKDPSLLDATLGNPEYWMSKKLPDDEDDE